MLENLLRIGRRAIVSFPNFGHWQVRATAAGDRPHAATRRTCPTTWYDTPNAHLCTIKDFADLARDVNANVERSVAFNWSGRQLSQRSPLGMQNLFGEKAVFVMRRGGGRV